MAQSASSLHEAWALAGLLRARYGDNALPHAIDQAKSSKRDHETGGIWQAVVECLSRITV